MVRSSFAAVAVVVMVAVGNLNLVDAQWAGDKLTNSDQILAPNPITCQCSDAAPRATIYYNVSYTCLQQLSFGACDQDFVKNSQIAEMPEGWCQVTCGRCSCCKSVSQVAQDNGLTTLISAAKIAGLDAQLASPASMFTILAPSNDAFTKALPTLGYSSLDAVPASLMKNILLYHIVPPHVGIDAVWTTPFFSASKGTIATAVPDAGLTFTSTDGNITVKGDSNSASITNSDITACKSFIDIIDAVLIPPKNAATGALPANAGNIALSLGPAPSAAQQQAVLTASSTDSSSPTASQAVTVAGK